MLFTSNIAAKHGIQMNGNQGNGQVFMLQEFDNVGRGKVPGKLQGRFGVQLDTSGGTRLAWE